MCLDIYTWIAELFHIGVERSVLTNENSRTEVHFNSLLHNTSWMIWTFHYSRTSLNSTLNCVNRYQIWVLEFHSNEDKQERVDDLRVYKLIITLAYICRTKFTKLYPRLVSSVVTVLLLLLLLLLLLPAFTTTHSYCTHSRSKLTRARKYTERRPQNSPLSIRRESLWTIVKTNETRKHCQQKTTEIS